MYDASGHGGVARTVLNLAGPPRRAPRRAGGQPVPAARRAGLRRSTRGSGSRCWSTYPPGWRPLDRLRHAPAHAAAADAVRAAHDPAHRPGRCGGACRRSSPGSWCSTRPSLHLAATRWAAPGVRVVGQDHKNFPTRFANRRQAAVLRAAVPLLDAYVVLTHADAEDYRRELPGLRTPRRGDPQRAAVAAGRDARAAGLQGRGGRRPAGPREGLRPDGRRVRPGGPRAPGLAAAHPRRGRRARPAPPAGRTGSGSTEQVRLPGLRRRLPLGAGRRRGVRPDLARRGLPDGADRGDERRRAAGRDGLPPRPGRDRRRRHERLPRRRRRRGRLQRGAAHAGRGRRAAPALRPAGPRGLPGVRRRRGRRGLAGPVRRDSTPDPHAASTRRSRRVHPGVVSVEA